jgi:transposase-like protein
MDRYLVSIKNYRDLLEAWDKIKGKVPLDAIFFEVRCKYCNSREISKYGRYKNMQYWRCKSCSRKFTDNGAAPGMKIPENRIQSAISMYYKGIRIFTIRKQLLDDFNYCPSVSTVYTWIYRNAEIILAYTRNHHPKVGDQWMVFESNIVIGSDKLWILDLIDVKTHFLLASRFSINRNIEDLRMLLESARDKAGKIPGEIIAKRRYLKDIELILGSDTQQTTLRSFIQLDKTNFTDSWKWAIKVRPNLINSQKILSLAQSILVGWIYYKNYVVTEYSPKGNTAAQEAGIDQKIETNLRVEEYRI